MSSSITVEVRAALAQSVRIAFRLLYLATVLLAAVWMTGNIRNVPPDSRAVILRFGRVDRVQDAGLLLALPPPVEQIRLLPARERQIEYAVSGPLSELGASGVSQDEINHAKSAVSIETDLAIVPNDDLIQVRPQKDADNESYFLTSDGSTVRLNTTLFFGITDPAAYMIAEEHVRPALRRLYLATAVTLCASHDLNDFLVARPDQVDMGPTGGGISARRQAIRAALVSGINQRLSDLRRGGTDLGVEISRVDEVALLPPIAKTAFDDVLTAAQIADQEAAAARTDAAQTMQQANQLRDQILSEANAVAEEKVRDAMAKTVNITALDAEIDPANRNNLLAQIYREQIGAILQKAGRVDAVDPQNGRHLILSGPEQ